MDEQPPFQTTPVTAVAAGEGYATTAGGSATGASSTSRKLLLGPPADGSVGRSDAAR